LDEIPKELSPSKLNELFPLYRKAVAKEGSAAADEQNNCNIQ